MLRRVCMIRTFLNVNRIDAILKTFLIIGKEYIQIVVKTQSGSIVKKKLPVIVAFLFLCLSVSLFFIYGKKNNAPTLVAIDKEIKSAYSFRWEEKPKRYKDLVESIDSKLQKAEKAHGKDPYFWFLKARHTLLLRKKEKVVCGR